MLKQLYDEAASRLLSFNVKELEETGFLSLNKQFFPSVHYPPITMYQPISQEQLFGGYNLPFDKRFDVYVHIPFCMKYCSYCHYPVIVGDVPEEKDRYLLALEKDMDLYLRLLGISKIEPRSILVGGGTPTYLSPEQLRRFLEFLGRRVNLPASTQFSYDVDPVSLLGPKGADRLSVLKEYGVHRLTIGVQSLDNVVLKEMNRHHNARAAVDAVRRAKAAGFKVNVEFIYGYPGQSVDSWITTLEQSLQLEADEIQIYRLKFIPYGDHNGVIQSNIPGDPGGYFERTMLMKSLAVSILENGGYFENIRRVFSRTRQDYSHYAHNQCCNLFDQLGFGLTAFSSLRDRFGLNALDLADYYRRIDSGRLPLTRGMVRGKADQCSWAFVLPLKNRQVYKKYFFGMTGMQVEDIFKDKIERLKRFDLLREDPAGVALTARGGFFADEVCHQFHQPEYIPFPKSSYKPGPLSPHNN